MMPNFRYVRPQSLTDAIKELGASDSRVHAGGTDLLGCLHDGVLTASKLVAIGGIRELRGITPSASGTRIGALTTLSEIADSRVIFQQYKALAQAARTVASPQIRNQGTLGGNLCQRPRCWYYRGDFRCFRKGGDACSAMEGENEFHCILGGNGCYMVHPSDTAAPLIALDAQVRITGPKGTRTIPLASFFVPPSTDVTRETVLEPREILTEVVLPPGNGVISSYRKARVRQSWDFALAGVALALRMKGDRVEAAHVVLSGVAPTPWRASAAEQALVGKRLDSAAAVAAAAAAVRGSEPLSQNTYKVDLVRGIVEESILALG